VSVSTVSDGAVTGGGSAFLWASFAAGRTSSRGVTPPECFGERVDELVPALRIEVELAIRSRKLSVSLHAG
jgi:hypothetical protein